MDKNPRTRIEYSADRSSSGLAIGCYEHDGSVFTCYAPLEDVDLAYAEQAAAAGLRVFGSQATAPDEDVVFASHEVANDETLDAICTDQSRGFIQLGLPDPKTWFVRSLKEERPRVWVMRWEKRSV
jgi:hypothetical protein